jgi:hypothetical protein
MLLRELPLLSSIVGDVECCSGQGRGGGGSSPLPLIVRIAAASYPPCPFAALFNRQTAFIRHRQAAAIDAINSGPGGSWDSVLNVILPSPRRPWASEVADRIVPQLLRASRQKAQNIFSSCAICRMSAYSWSLAATNCVARRIFKTG